MTAERLPSGGLEWLYGRTPTEREHAAIAHALRWEAPLLLCHVRAGDAHEPYPLVGGGEEVVGSAPRAQLRVRGDKYVSRVHAMLSTRAGRWGIEDAGSTNGIAIHGARRRQWSQLRHGDRIELGERTHLLFVDRADTTHHTPALDPTRLDSRALTAAERDVVRVLASAMRDDEDAGPVSDAEIAAWLGLQLSTVKTHISDAYRRLGLGPDVVDRRLRLARLGLTL